MKMMRLILGRGRKISVSGEIETWVDWIQRVTLEARRHMVDYKIPDWVNIQYSRAQKWRDTILDKYIGRWVYDILCWEPMGTQSRGRPRSRWLD